MSSVRLTEKRAISFLMWALCIVYFTSYFSRLGYATVIAEIIESEGITKADASLATTACFITYGAGQLISGWLGDRISPKKIIFSGIFITTACNILLPLCGNTGARAVVWGVNGFAQALLWPPMMRMITAYLDPDNASKCCVRASMAANVATILLYLLSPLMIRLGGWRSVFALSATLAATVGLLWIVVMTRFEQRCGVISSTRSGAKKEDPEAASGVSVPHLIVAEGILFVMIAIVMQGILRDGVTTWLPSYLVEVFHLETGSSILSSVVIPIFSVISFQFFAWVNNRFFRNEIRCSAVLFGIGMVLSAAMAALFTASAAISALLAAMLTACMHGINLMLICNLPARFAHTGKVSMISGVLNSCTYVGSALSTYGFALVAQNFGWRTTVVCWIMICLIGVIACVTAQKMCRNLTN